MEHTSNPFTSVDEPAILGPGTLEMALPLVQAVGIRPGMRLLEVGGGTGQVATLVARLRGASNATGARGRARVDSP